MRAIGVLVVALALGVTALPAAADSNQEKADKLFVEGRELLRKGDAKTACERFHAANALNTTAPGVMLNLGLCYEQQGKIATSLKWYRKAQTAASEAKPQATDFEEAAKEKKKNLAGQVATIKVDITAAGDVEIHVDGERIARSDLATPYEVDKGPHKIEASAPGKETYVENITATDGQVTNVAIPELKIAIVKPPATAEPKSRRKLGLALAIPSVALLAGIPIIAKVMQTEYDKTGKPELTPALFVGLGTVWVAALGGAALGTYFIIKKPKAERTTAFVPVVAPDQLGVAAIGRF
jgi:hypothetical protein